MRISLLLALVLVVVLVSSQLRSHALTTVETQDSSWSELTRAMERMHVAMASIDSSGKSDVDFVRLMLPHHQAAVQMARAELLYGTDPQMRRLAQEIVTDQQSEVQLMELWLKRHSK